MASKNKMVDDRFEVWMCPIISIMYKLTQHSVKPCGSSGTVWGCFAPSDPGRLTVIDGAINIACLPEGEPASISW